jgi:hypothetical protein
MGCSRDFKVPIETRVVGDKHVGVGTGFHPREPLRHEGGIDASHDARVVQFVSQFGASGPGICSERREVRAAVVVVRHGLRQRHGAE